VIRNLVLVTNNSHLVILRFY